MPTGGIHRVRAGPIRAGDLDLVSQGDEAALRRVIRRYAPLVHRIALSVTGSEFDADDVSQEVFIALPELLHSYREGNFIGWLKVVSTRKALVLLRGERRQRQHNLVLVRVDSHEERILSRIAVGRALGRIDPALRAVFLLREVHGLKHREIAEAMDISESLSQARLHRARRALRKLLPA
jgi:RNA polymerase sigma-70 factor (ECF subfamily)